VITLRRIVISLLLAGSFFGIFYAFTRPTDNQQPGLIDQAVRHIDPPAGALVLRQTEISFDLDPTYTGILIIDKREIPEDQLTRIAGLNRVAFTPADGKEITELAPGPHTAVAVFWPSNRTREDAGRQYPWNFNVH
jgi:hypothetical protein